MLSAHVILVTCFSQEATFRVVREVSFAVQSANFSFVLVYCGGKKGCFIIAGKISFFFFLSIYMLDSERERESA